MRVPKTHVRTGRPHRWSRAAVTTLPQSRDMGQRCVGRRLNVPSPPRAHTQHKHTGYTLPVGKHCPSSRRSHGEAGTRSPRGRGRIPENRPTFFADGESANVWAARDAMLRARSDSGRKERRGSLPVYARALPQTETSRPAERKSQTKTRRAERGDPSEERPRRHREQKEESQQLYIPRCLPPPPPHILLISPGDVYSLGTPAVRFLNIPPKMNRSEGTHRHEDSQKFD